MAITAVSDRHRPHSLLWALLASLALHSVVLQFVPGFSLLDAEHPDTPIIVELSPPIPLPPPAPEKTLPMPEKIPPAPIKPKLQKPVIPPPVTMPPMQPAPPVQNNSAATPPTEAPKMAAEHIIALEAKPAEPPPAANTVATAPQPSAPVTERNEEDTSAARNAYGALLAKEFAKHRKYPQLARMRGWQGTVKISLQIDTEGNAANPSVSESSGKQLLDEQALETVKKALPLPLPPEVLRGKGFSIVVPIVFRLENG